MEIHSPLDAYRTAVDDFRNAVWELHDASRSGLPERFNRAVERELIAWRRCVQIRWLTNPGNALAAPLKMKRNIPQGEAAGLYVRSVREQPVERTDRVTKTGRPGGLPIAS